MIKNLNALANEVSHMRDTQPPDPRPDTVKQILDYGRKVFPTALLVLL